MRVPLDIVLEPGRNDAAMVLAVAASVFVFAYSTLFGAVTILFYYALWFPLAALVPARMAAAARDGWVVVAFVALALMSVLWSDAPGTSLRAGIQLATHAVCAFAAARLVSLRALVIGLTLGTFMVLVWSVVFGRSSYDPLDGSYTFVGLFGSKNQLGFFASIAVLASTFAMTLVRGVVWRGALAALGLFGLVVLMASDSATSLIALMAALVTLGLALVLRRLNASARLVLVAFGLLSAGLVSVVAVQGGAVEVVLGAFGKDATLTGRTYLWSEGMAVFAENPWGGTGYGAFWVQGFAHAERLWAEFYIESRSGFHFHNTWIEALVELGVVGTALVVILFLGTLARALTGTVTAAEPLPYIFVLVVMALLVVRSLSEVDAMTPFVIGSFLMFLIAVFVRHPLGSARELLGRPGSELPVGTAQASDVPKRELSV